MGGAPVPEAWRYGAFDGTDLDTRLRALGVDEVVLTGKHTHTCVRHTAYGALVHHYRITVPGDAVCAFEGVDEEESTSLSAERVRGTGHNSGRTGGRVIADGLLGSVAALAISAASAAVAEPHERAALTWASLRECCSTSRPPTHAGPPS